MTPQELLTFPGLPPYLKKLLKNADTTKKYDKNYQAELYQEALNALVDKTIGQNVAGIKKPIPQKLPFNHLSYMLSYLFTFKNIHLSTAGSMNRKGILGMFMDTGKQQGIYQTNEEELYYLLSGFFTEYKTNEIQEIFEKIKRESDRVQITESKHLFLVNNGIFNQKTKTLETFTPDFVGLVKIPIDYKDNITNPIIVEPDGYQWDVDTWIYDLADHDEDTNTLLWQVIADCLQPAYCRKRSIWFYSDKGNNGKGTFGQLIKNVLGPSNYASLAVADFKRDFIATGLIGVAANIADENDVNQYIDSVRAYKASVTGDDLIINVKHEDPIRMQFKGANIQMMNGLPKTRDTTDSFYRRLLIVPFVKSFTDNGERPKIKEDYIYRKEVLEYVIHKALNIVFNEFVEPARTKEFMNHYKETNNPIMQYWDDFEDQFTWDLLPTQFLYDLYISWTKRNNPSGKELSKQSFVDGLKQILLTNDYWEMKFDKNCNVRTGSLMDNDEPLITEFELKNWQKEAYRGTNMKEQRNFKRKSMYRGLLRKTKTN